MRSVSQSSPERVTTPEAQPLAASAAEQLIASRRRW